MNRKIFELMIKRTRLVIANWGLDLSNVILVSGGSAWADHVAVKLWLDSVMSGSCCDLKLYLPCPVVLTSSSQTLQFETNQSSSWTDNPGSILNNLHTSFSERMGQNFSSLSDLRCAHALGATFDCNSHGFHKRNIEVGKSDYLVAFTWGDSTTEPKDGGTLHTWKNCRSKKKVHVPLQSLIQNEPIRNAKRKLHNLEEF